MLASDLQDDGIQWWKVWDQPITPRVTPFSSYLVLRVTQQWAHHEPVKEIPPKLWDPIQG